MVQKVTVCWLRRDLRLHDNAALYHALRSGHPVVPLFIFDTAILDRLEDKHDARLTFIHNCLQALQDELVAHGSTLHVMHGRPADVFERLTELYDVREVHAAVDYEPYATKRDAQVKQLLQEHDIELQLHKDQVIFDTTEVVKDNGTPYAVFTPYSKRWRNTLTPFHLKPYPTEKYFRNFFQHAPRRTPSIKSLGFIETNAAIPPAALSEAIAASYDKTRDFPAWDGTTRLSIHLRFGTVSIRRIMTEAQQLNDTLFKELIWREFYQMMIWHHPHVVTQSFRPEYDNIKWRNNNADFEAWCNGQTGYPLVDAGMRQMNETGWMHNRVRMVTASFLCKHLLIDWRWGEAYFAQRLLDYDLASNNGGWQWCAGSGADAAPYFRVFNPESQAKKFDPKQQYIRRWVPEVDSAAYARPLVEHSFARERCLKVYKAALKKG